jgi:hypothetical protein
VQRLDFDANYVLAQCPLQAAYAKPVQRRQDEPAPASVLRSAALDAPDELAEPVPSEEALA